MTDEWLGQGEFGVMLEVKIRGTISRIFRYLHDQNSGTIKIGGALRRSLGG